MIERPSPNHDPRPPGVAVDMLVLHYTGMTDARAALDRLCDPAAKVSAHYLVDEDGAVHRLVEETRRAWHAGRAVWRECTDVNGASIGIELVNPGHEFGYRPFSDAQMDAVIALARDILARHPIPARNVVGHSDVAPARRADPGELFDWARLAAVGVGLWPAPEVRGEMGLTLRAGDAGLAVAELQAALAEIGYGVARDGLYDEGLAAVVTAFQRHFRPRRVDGVADPETARLALRLARELARDEPA